MSIGQEERQHTDHPTKNAGRYVPDVEPGLVRRRIDRSGPSPSWEAWHWPACCPPALSPKAPRACSVRPHGADGDHHSGIGSPFLAEPGAPIECSPDWYSSE